MIDLLLALALVIATSIEAPPPRSTATVKKVATKTCLDQFDALAAQHSTDRNPGEIRAIVNEGEAYAVAPSRNPGWLWAFPSSPALGTIKVSASCFD